MIDSTWICKQSYLNVVLTVQIWCVCCAVPSPFSYSFKWYFLVDSLMKNKHSSAFYSYTRWLCMRTSFFFLRMLWFFVSHGIACVGLGMCHTWVGIFCLFADEVWTVSLQWSHSLSLTCPWWPSSCCLYQKGFRPYGLVAAANYGKWEHGNL